MKKPLFEDTPLEIEEILLAGYRRMTVAQKMQVLAGLNQMAKAAALAAIKQKYPNSSEQELKLRWGARFLPPDLMREAFDWDVEREGY